MVKSLIGQGRPLRSKKPSSEISEELSCGVIDGEAGSQRKAK